MDHENPTIQGQYQPNQISSQNVNIPNNNTTSSQAFLLSQPSPLQNSPYMEFYSPPQGNPLTNLSGQNGDINIQPQPLNNINYENIENID